MKRVIDSVTHVRVAMLMEDRGADATLILEYQGRRIETIVAAWARETALAAYAARDLKTFGALFDGPPPARIGHERRAA